jgi:hypothetical protein
MSEKIFAFVINNEIFHIMKLPDSPNFDGVIAGLRSGPQIIEATGFDDISPSWRFIDGVLYRPAAEPHYHDEGPGYELDD